jgi:hypothetical protein
MLVIRFKSTYTSEEFGLDIPELTVACHSITYNKEGTLGENVSIIVKKAASIVSFQADKFLPDDGTLADTICHKNQHGTDQNGNPIIEDNPNFYPYFSKAALLEANGDIYAQATKYYREVYMVSSGIPLEATEIVSI